MYLKNSHSKQNNKKICQPIQIANQLIDFSAVRGFAEINFQKDIPNNPEEKKLAL